METTERAAGSCVGHCFYREVLRLAKKFFLYYGSRLKQDTWILNTRDGELLPLKYFGAEDYSPIPDPTKLTPAEVDELRSNFTAYKLKWSGHETRIHMVNPLFVISSLHTSLSSSSQCTWICNMRKRLDVDWERF